MKKTFPNPKIDELVEKLKDYRGRHHGFLMAVSRASNLNYNNLCSVLNGHRKMGYHAFFEISAILSRITTEFDMKDAKKKV